ncbi:MAG: hypothetical protein ACPG8W_06155 [Candidatus Promineifilaceae bacterium]
MQTNAEKIVEFQRTMGGDAPDLPTVPSDKTLDLRNTLIREEYEEVTEAIELLMANREDPAALAHLMHELADLLYVTYGAMVTCGVDANAVFAEVHRANMQKASGPRRADGKVLKPKDFKPANVAAVLEKMKK